MISINPIKNSLEQTIEMTNASAKETIDAKQTESTPVHGSIIFLLVVGLILSLGFGFLISASSGYVTTSRSPFEGLIVWGPFLLMLLLLIFSTTRSKISVEKESQVANILIPLILAASVLGAILFMGSFVSR